MSKRKIPIDPTIFGEFKNGFRLKIAYVYFWFRSQSTYSVEDKLEYLNFKDGKKYTGTELAEQFNFGLNQIYKIMKFLTDRKLMKVNIKNKRYEFDSSMLLDGKWVYIDLSLLHFLLDNSEDGSLILVYGLLLSKYHIFGAGTHIFCNQDLNKFLGYSDTTKTTTARDCMHLLESSELIYCERTNAFNSKHAYYQYQRLIGVKSNLDNI